MRSRCFTRFLYPIVSKSPIMKRMDLFHEKAEYQLLERILSALERLEQTSASTLSELKSVERTNLSTLSTLKSMDESIKKIERDLAPRLIAIEIVFTALPTPKGAFSMATPGPVVLTTAGQQTTASIVGFDQFGNLWTGPIPSVTYAIDDSSIATSTPNADGLTDLVTAVANGVANLTATLTSDEGALLTDTETVTVAIAPPPPPVLSSVKIAFA